MLARNSESFRNLDAAPNYEFTLRASCADEDGSRTLRIAIRATLRWGSIPASVEQESELLCSAFLKTALRLHNLD